MARYKRAILIKQNYRQGAQKRGVCDAERNDKLVSAGN